MEYYSKKKTYNFRCSLRVEYKIRRRKSIKFVPLETVSLSFYQECDIVFYGIDKNDNGMKMRPFDGLLQ